MRVEARATSISWIPSDAVTGMMEQVMTTGVAHVDEPPPDQIDGLDDLRRADRFRFANELWAWAEFDDDDALPRYGQGGRLVMGSSTLRIGRLGVTVPGAELPVLIPAVEVGPDSVRFRQTVGGRTGFPLPRTIDRPPFVRTQAPIVWTTLALTLNRDGSSTIDLAGASPFPRHWIYNGDGRLCLKSGLADWGSWLAQPSRKHTPWGDEDSPIVVAAVESVLERHLAGLIMRGGAAPTVRSVAAGDVLMRQGELGDTIALVLDGLLSVSVDGRVVGELGPGVVVGERAALDGGRRSATVTATTAVRVAEVPLAGLDHDQLVELARGHRRESHAPGAP